MHRPIAWINNWVRIKKNRVQHTFKIPLQFLPIPFGCNYIGLHDSLHIAITDERFVQKYYGDRQPGGLSSITVGYYINTR